MLIADQRMPGVARTDYLVEVAIDAAGQETVLASRGNESECGRPRPSWTQYATGIATARAAHKGAPAPPPAWCRAFRFLPSVRSACRTIGLPYVPPLFAL
jgi:hypothetical protein